MTKSQMLAKLNEKLESIVFRNIDDDQAANRFWELAQVIKYVEKDLYSPDEVEMVLTRYKLTDRV